MSRGIKIGVWRSGRPRTRAVIANHDRSRFNEAGDTLVEVLLALIVLGLASVALLIAFSTSISASAVHRRLATSDIVLSAVSQQAIASIESQLNLFTTCQTLSYFQANVPMTVPSAYSSSYTVQLTNVQYWNSTLATFGAACTTDEPEEITVAVTDNGQTYSNSFVVDYPLAGATTQPGAGTAAQLVWSTSPSSTASTSLPFTQQPVLEVEDANGNAVTTDLSPVIISIESGSSGELSGCAGSEAAGYVTFSACELNKSGTYTLMATDGNLTTTLVSDPTITVSGSTTPYLVFTTEPQGGKSGLALSPEPVISVYIGGVLDVAWPTGTINLSTSGGVWPSACDQVTVTLGVATVPSSCTFEGGIFYDPVSNQTLAVPYTMSASGSGLIPATSTSFTVSSAGPATQLVFAAQPSGVSAASATTPFSTQPVVDIEDAFGNVVTSSSATVSLSLDANSFSASLSGCSSTTTKGVATFSGCEVSKFGTGYTLEASSGSLALTPSNYQSTAFNVTGLASYMVFTKQPAAGVSGSTLPTQPVITIYDASNYVVTASTTPLTLIASGGSLTLCTNLTPYQGVVTVATCNFAGVVGTNYTLTATQGLISKTSNPISPTAAGVPTTLAFTTEPGAGLAGSPLTTQPIVKVEDSAGNVVLISSATISLAPAPTTGTLSNCGDLQAVSGVVNVSGCTFGGVIGTQYTMTATSANLASAISSSFSVTGPGPIDGILLSGCTVSIVWNTSCVATATAEDAWGNVSTSYNAGFTLAQTGGTGAVTGLTTVTAVNGIASDAVTGSVVGVLQINATDPTAPTVASNSLTITVVGIPQTVAFYSSSSYTPPAITTATTTYSPSGPYQTYAQGSGAGTITFASLSPSVCTVNSSTGLVSILGAGPCSITADAGATLHYADSGTTTLALTINKANQATLSVTSLSGTYLTALTLTTSGGSGTGAITFVAVNGTATGCAVNTIAPGLYTLTSTSAGSCLVTATSATDSNFNAATSAQATVNLAKANQAALTVSSTSGTYLTPLTLTTSGGSGTGAITFVAVNGTATGCTVNGTAPGPYTLTSTSAGTCLVTANSAADSNFNAATSAQATVNLGKANQATLTVSSLSGTYLTPLTLTTSGGSGTGAITFAAVNGTATGCTVNGTAPGPYTLTSTSAGSCLVTANSATDSNFNAATSAQATVNLAKANQATLTVSSLSGTYLTPLTLTTSGGSGTGATTYAAVNGTATGCTVNGTAPGPYTLTSTSTGTCLVTAARAADSNFNAATSAQATVTLFGYWTGTSATASVTSAAFTAPLGETVLILATYEGAAPVMSCSTPTGGALNTYTKVLTPAAWYATGGEYRMCAYAGKGTNTSGGITEAFTGTGTVTVASIQVIEISNGDNSAHFALATTNTGSSNAPIWKLTGALTSNTEFLFGALTNGSNTPPTWSPLNGFASIGTLTMGTGTTTYVPTVYFGTPSAATVTGGTSATAHWGTIGIEVIP
jgi:type II secretory pathway pseudopilin PulG